MLLHLLSELNGYNRIGGGYLCQLMTHDYIFHTGDVKLIEAFLTQKSLNEVFKLVIPGGDIPFTKRVLTLCWISIKLEKEIRMRNLTAENSAEVISGDSVFRDLLFGKTTMDDFNSLTLGLAELDADSTEEDGTEETDCTI